MSWLRKVFCIFAAAVIAVNAMALPAAAKVNNDMLFDAVAPAPEAEGTAQGGNAAAPEEETGTEAESASQMPLYFQTDYPDTMYGEGTIKSNGCSITCLAMVATYMTGHEYTPDQLADYFGGKASNNMKRLEYGSEQMQLPFEKAENWHVTYKALQEGKVAIALMNSNSLFTSAQHFIVLAGINEEGRIIVHDPNAANYELWNLKEGFEIGFEEGKILRGYSGAWIYDKSAMPEEPFLYEEEKYDGELRYPEIQLTKEETNLLARMIWVEARGESLEGQQAIAEVVFNRMMAENFPDTLKGVVYAEGQFSSTAFLDDAEPNQTQYEAIQNALEGPYVLPETVVFFGKGAVNDNVWGRIGGHVFCHQWWAGEEESEPMETEATEVSNISEPS